eukprot:scaffold99634_cov60-Phaeocystis_antarctica.AAC.4
MLASRVGVGAFGAPRAPGREHRCLACTRVGAEEPVGGARGEAHAPGPPPLGHEGPEPASGWLCADWPKPESAGLSSLPPNILPAMLPKMPDICCAWPALPLASSLIFSII